MAAAIYHALGRAEKSCVFCPPKYVCVRTHRFLTRRHIITTIDGARRKHYVDQVEAISAQFLPVDKHWGEWELLYGCAGAAPAPLFM